MKPSLPEPWRPRRWSPGLAARRPAVGGWAALLVVYIVWGSTYLAIRVGVETIPPLLLAGVRYLTAGLILFPFAIRSGPAAVRAAAMQMLTGGVTITVLAARSRESSVRSIRPTCRRARGWRWPT